MSFSEGSHCKGEHSDEDIACSWDANLCFSSNLKLQGLGSFTVLIAFEMNMEGDICSGMGLVDVSFCKLAICCWSGKASEPVFLLRNEPSLNSQSESDTEQGL